MKEQSNQAEAILLHECINGKDVKPYEHKGELISVSMLLERFCNAETKPQGTVGTDHHLAELDLEQNYGQMVFFIPSKSYAGVDIEIRIWFEDEKMSPLSAYTHDGETSEELLTTEDKMAVLHAYFCNVHQLIKFA
ncbi:hypothetical protein OTK49_28265 [Vibrio coralliirubri]|uniref:hypothetical protein n=1 Tax=Vibrio coralliirubri TaxID=1516159 RepID=UPI002283FC24|nr:hypothetical protein [Vibrio coralliirubri]MCY9866438.1 hypothetical protein [Vibrio coralliirubri]